MILYVVNVTVKKDFAEEWLTWMNGVHIPDVMNTGYFTGADIYSVILPAKGTDEVTYSVHYISETYEKFMSYTVKDSKRLRQKHTEKFGDLVKVERFVFEKL